MGSKSLPIFTVDSFTDKPFSGNPAAVCLEEDAASVLTDNVRQQIGTEMNLSETAFLSKLSPVQDFKKDNRFSLRWFTPKSEIVLCGHATLASAAVLFSQGNTSDVLMFETLSGTLSARKEGDKIVLNFPIDEPAPADGYDTLVKATIGDLPFEEVLFASALRMVVIRLKDGTDRSVLDSLAPSEHDLLAASPLDGPVKIVIVTLRGASPYDFYSRVFASWYGIYEDPVTGAAHTVLGPYWGKILGKKEMTAYQSSKRGGTLWLKLRDDGRIDLAGNACFVLQGRISIP